MPEEDNALKIDLYELTMAAGYYVNDMNPRAVFELKSHSMPKNRSYLIFCGLAQIVDYVLNLRFTKDDVQFLKNHPSFKGLPKGFFDYLRKFRFTGNIYAMPEGEVFFAKEPVIQVEAPLIEAQVLETYLLSMTNIQSMVASKASRVVQAARRGKKERQVVDFGSRRAHGPEAGIFAARASYLSGCAGTSNVYAGREFGIPLYGTVAHSWVEAFDSEEESYTKYFKVFKDKTVLLIDTFDTVKAAKMVTQLPYRKKIKAVRLDSGDLLSLSRKVRKILDDAGLKNIKIIASGNLNEYKIERLVGKNAPIDSFGVGTEMVTSKDFPSLDLTYKLVQVGDEKSGIKFKAKKSKGKATLPGRKQVFRYLTDMGRLRKDVLGLYNERGKRGGRQLLRPVIRNGKRVGPLPSIEKIRKYVQKRLTILPRQYFQLKKTAPPRVSVSKKLRSASEELNRRL